MTKSLDFKLTFPNNTFIKLNPGRLDVSSKVKLPVVILFGWAGSKDKYLSKYSQVYEEKGLITLRYTAPVKWLFVKRDHISIIGQKLVKLLFELNFDNHPIFVHCFSNGGAFLYQNFSTAINYNDKPLELKGVIFDSAPGKRRLGTLFKAISAIMEGNVLYNFTTSLFMTMFLSLVWFVEVISNTLFASENVLSNNPFANLLNEKNRCPQLFIYSKNDDLIPHTDVEEFASHRKKRGVDVTTVCYDNSLHVKHLPENRESYVTSVFQFINKCLNGSN
ncbi:transmembrane protein 53 isoform X2 [Anthonomus grandis grandis]|uniref:transmembrane protein 53 isoform X2 n=1 Tax=Anthonomus grandis grandis TaxID=2921223 RepID=UPI0021668106|nr:transmembrane protein 53 isoform X2 [Anthonomus grandis grandis]